MAQWHLNELRASFERYGWRVVDELPGNRHGISGSWQLQRAGSNASVVIIDFEGLDDAHTLPVHQAYACRIRGSEHSLYFRRHGTSGSTARARWLRELASFVMAAGD